MYHLPTYLLTYHLPTHHLSTYLSSMFNLPTYLSTYHLTSYFSIIYLLINYLLSTYLSFIYLIYLPTHLWLVLFLWRKLVSTDASQKSNQHTPTPCMQVLANGTILKNNPRCAVFSQPEGLAEPEWVLTGKLLLYFIHVSISIFHHLTRQAPLALTQDSVEIPHCVASVYPACMPCHMGSRAGTSPLL